MVKMERKSIYLAQAYSAAISLGSLKEVYGLFDLILILVLSGQIIAGSFVSCLITDRWGLEDFKFRVKDIVQ